MRRRRRALIGALFMILFVTVYALFAMSLAQAPAIQRAPSLVQFPIYAVLGLVWVLPLLPLIRWIERRGDR
jgi:Protein of unknown function (DUF2842)